MEWSRAAQPFIRNVVYTYVLENYSLKAYFVLFVIIYVFGLVREIKKKKQGFINTKLRILRFTCKCNGITYIAIEVYYIGIHSRIFQNQIRNFWNCADCHNLFVVEQAPETRGWELGRSFKIKKKILIFVPLCLSKSEAYHKHCRILRKKSSNMTKQD